ncbi:MAG: hypothetical protein ACJ739_15145 [Acidimicrobiales bacterium]
MTEPTEPAADPTDADPVPPPPIEQNPSATGLVVDDDEGQQDD